MSSSDILAADHSDESSDDEASVIHPSISPQPSPAPEPQSPNSDVVIPSYCYAKKAREASQSDNFNLANSIDEADERRHVFLARALARIEAKFSRDHGDDANTILARKRRLDSLEVMWTAHDTRQAWEARRPGSSLGSAIQTFNSNEPASREAAREWLLDKLHAIVEAPTDESLSAISSNATATRCTCDVIQLPGVRELLQCAGFADVKDFAKADSDHIMALTSPATNDASQAAILCVVDALGAQLPYASLQLDRSSISALTIRRLLGLAALECMPAPEEAASIIEQATAVLAKEPNFVTAPVPTAERPVVVVGDLHGQSNDLRTIFERVGYPSHERVFVFNGDFVDRGTHGTEVLLTLLAAKAAFPDTIFLNRGNHEDRHICQAYGFHQEVLNKYGPHLLTLFEELFPHIPLGTLVPGTCLVVHGGPPADICSLETLNTSFSRADVMSVSGINVKTCATSHRIASEVMWSDPEPDLAGECPNLAYGAHVAPNHYRGLGLLYDLDHAAMWLKQLEVPFLCRSHELICEADGSECIEEGIEELVLPSGDASLFTIFSASNYDGGMNKAAVLRFKGPGQRPKTKSFEGETLDLKNLILKNKRSLGLLIAQNRFRIASRFEAMRAAGELPDAPLIEVAKWAEVMRDVIKIHVYWERWQPELVDADESGRINFEVFLQLSVLAITREGCNQQAVSDASHLTKSYPLVKLLFNTIDTDGNGMVDKDEFCAYIKEVNEGAPDDEIIDGEKLFREMDLNNDGSLQMSEMCECFKATLEFDGESQVVNM